MTIKSVKDYDKFMLRFPDGMRDVIADRARTNGRSMNSEIIQIIEDAVTPHEEYLLDDGKDRVVPITQAMLSALIDKASQHSARATVKEIMDNFTLTPK